ncbi:MAG: hypothetical protein KDA58_03600, partial [Planctomycetaceae bacterium]|nr:hypothetical protein [Planctomycetaceae bacterium]
NIFTIDRATIQANGAAGDNQRNEMGPQNVGHGAEIQVTGSGTLVSTWNNVDVLQNSGDGIDYHLTTGASRTVSTTTMFGVQASQNSGRGLDVLLEHEGSRSTSNWNIGRADRSGVDLISNPFDTLYINRFNENAREGVVFDQQATTFNQSNTSSNPDVYVEENLPDFLDILNVSYHVDSPMPEPGPYAVQSSQHPNVANNVVGTGGSTATPASIRPSRVHFTSNIQVINTEVANNGGYGGFEDGLVMAVGFLTRMNAQVGNVSFGGNVGDDLRAYPQQSNELLPPLSHRDTSSANGPNNSRLVYDAVGYLDLAMGVIDDDLDGVPDFIAGNGRAANSGTGGVGNGDQISIITEGTSQTSQISNPGIITTADPIRIRDTRSVMLAGRLHFGDETTGGTNIADDETINDFFQNGVQQQLDVFFDTRWIQLTTGDLLPQPNTTGPAEPFHAY